MLSAARPSRRTAREVSSATRFTRGSVAALNESTDCASALVPSLSRSIGPSGALSRPTVVLKLLATRETSPAAVFTDESVFGSAASAGFSPVFTVLSSCLSSVLALAEAAAMFSSASAARFWLSSLSSWLARLVASSTWLTMASPRSCSCASIEGLSGMRGGSSLLGASATFDSPLSSSAMKARPVTPW